MLASFEANFAHEFMIATFCEVVMLLLMCGIWNSRRRIVNLVFQVEEPAMRPFLISHSVSAQIGDTGPGTYYYLWYAESSLSPWAL